MINLSQIRKSDLTPEMRAVANVIGMEKTRELIKRCGGTTVYIPKIRDNGDAGKAPVVGESKFTAFLKAISFDGKIDSLFFAKVCLPII